MCNRSVGRAFGLISIDVAVCRVFREVVKVAVLNNEVASRSGILVPGPPPTENSVIDVMTVHVLGRHAVLKSASLYSFIPDAGMRVVKPIELDMVDRSTASIVNIDHPATARPTAVIRNNAVLDGHVLGRNLKAASNVLAAHDGSRCADGNGTRGGTAIVSQSSARALSEIRTSVGRPRPATCFETLPHVMSTVHGLSANRRSGKEKCDT